MGIVWKRGKEILLRKGDSKRNSSLRKQKDFSAEKQNYCVKKSLITREVEARKNRQKMV